MKLKPYTRKKGHDTKQFASGVSYYKRNTAKLLKDLKLKASEKKKLSALVIFNAENEHSFYSIAPLSKAFDSLNIDMSAKGINLGEKSIFNHIANSSLRPLFFSFILKAGLYDLNNKKKHKEAGELFNNYLKEIEKASDIKLANHTKKLFDIPDLIIIGFKNKFTIYNPRVFVKTLAGYIFEKRLTIKQELVPSSLEYKSKWVKKYRTKALYDTCHILWKQLYNIKKKEKIGISFELINDKPKVPINDLLDSFVISYAMKETGETYCPNVSIGSGSSRNTMLEMSPKLSDLSAILTGCELSKDSNEPVFKAFKKLSKILEMQKQRINSSIFAISGEGYPGKHIFGEKIGYPTTSGKSRWQSAGQMTYKLSYWPQTMHDKREPLSRIGFTSTIPLDIFINSCNIDWMELNKKDMKIKNILEKCDYVKVESKTKNGSNFLVHLNRSDNGEKRRIKASDISIAEPIDKEFYKKTKIKAGTMANIPGGETFVTPESIEGTIVGDVLINIDKSYPLFNKKSLIIKSNEKGYKIISGPADVIKAINKNKSDAMKRLNAMAKNPRAKDLVSLQKSNFERIGEFAINTNPKAELCDYLIVNEKLANMMHIAIGSGFDPDRASAYHYDLVINSIKQKLDVYGITSKGARIDILSAGKFVI